MPRGRRTCPCVAGPDRLRWFELASRQAEVFEGFWNLGFRNGALAVGFGRRTRLQESSMGLARVGEQRSRGIRLSKCQR